MAKTLDDRLSEVESIIRQPSFLENKGLGNEVGYYVFDYPPEQELMVRSRIAEMKEKFNTPDSGFQIVEFDLYDMVIDILIEKGYLEKCFEFEKKKGFERITKSVGNMLRISSDESLIVQKIREGIPERAVVFLTGIGKIYPILRSHKILNNLHQAIDQVPVIMFYPGKYDGQELILFGEKEVKSDFKDADTAVVIYEPEQFYDFMKRKGYSGDYIHYLNLQPNGTQKDQYQLIDFLTRNPGTEKDKQHKILSWHFQNLNGNIEKSWYLTLHNCHRILLCKDNSFSGEREYRFINTKKHITEPYNEYIGFGSLHICAMRIDEFFNGVRLEKT